MKQIHTLHASLPGAACDTEADFHAAWLAHVGNQASPFAMALAGGLLADRFAWIFSAGYQAAMRHVFAGQVWPAWVALAVSEDRKPQAPLPGVTATAADDSYLLNGYKTWVAASDFVADLVITAALDEQTLCVHIPRQQPGLSLTTKPPGRVLPDLSQGIAGFEQARIDASQLLEPAAIRSFAAAEVLYIYIAFLASTWRRLEGRRDEIEPLLAQAEKLAGESVISREGPMHSFDAGVQQLLQSLRQAEFADNEKWRREYKLIAMYSRQ